MSLEDLDIFCVLCITGSASDELLQGQLGLEVQGRTSDDEGRQRHGFSGRLDVCIDEDVLVRIPNIAHGVDSALWGVGTERLDISAGRMFEGLHR